jgi:uncharacterized protein involved in high-affinity Fe2+ transport
MSKSHMIILLCLSVLASVAFAAEVPLCALPIGGQAAIDNAKIEGDQDPGCKDVLKNSASLLANTLKAHPNDGKYAVQLSNKSSTPAHIKVGAVYLQAITMAPEGMMRPANISDIHLEMDIHAQDNLKSSGFAPGDWLPNANISYTIQKIGDSKAIPCGFNMQTHKPSTDTTCKLMPMVASDGAHYGDNIKLDGPGFYVVTFNAASNPMGFGWHIDKESKILTTAYVDWKFEQSYLFKWTGIGKKGGY